MFEYVGVSCVSFTQADSYLDWLKTPKSKGHPQTMLCIQWEVIKSHLKQTQVNLHCESQALLANGWLETYRQECNSMVFRGKTSPDISEYVNTIHNINNEVKWNDSNAYKKILMGQTSALKQTMHVHPHHSHPFTLLHFSSATNWSSCVGSKNQKIYIYLYMQ